ncbi:hypothetical protein HYX05_01605 [Candidatus Woesearchaeota archaeon]|nr:hypothetical protein [Candidatus Woesearchaeota archaeon]
MDKKITIFIILTVLLAANASAAKYFVVEVKYFSGSLVFDQMGLRDVEYDQSKADESGFLIKTISFEDKVIDSLHYNISENKKYILYVPYSIAAARIEIYNPANSKIMDLDVSSFADTCGNGICEKHESYESCTKDCPSGSQDDFCDGVEDGICDPDCSPASDADCEATGTSTANTSSPSKTTQRFPSTPGTGETEKPREKSNYFIWILSALAAVIGISLYFFIKKKKENQTISSLRQYIGENVRHGYALQQIKDVLYREGYSEKEINKAIKSIQ